MSKLNDFIVEIEEHTGQRFDYSDRRHRLALKDKVNRLSRELEKLKRGIAAVSEGHDTYDPKSYKTILRSDRIK